MKKVYFMSMALAGMLAMAGCSNDDVAAVNEDVTSSMLAEGEGLVTINLTNTGIGTRSARPMGSSAAANNVDHVKLAVYSYNTGSSSWESASGVKIKGDDDMIIDWTASNTENVWDVSHNDDKTVTLEGLAASTKYKIVAYGYNGTTEPNVNPSDPGVFTMDNVIAPEEIFAGSSQEVTTTSNKKFPDSAVKVTMDRQVAGLLAYMEGIPTYVNDKLVKKVLVCANAHSTGFTFPSTDDFNGLNTEERETTLLTFDMTKIAANYKAEGQQEATYVFANVENGVAADEGTLPYADEYTGDIVANDLTLVESTVFGACYLLAYDDHVDSQTLTIKLMGDDPEPLKTLNVVSSEGAEHYKYDIRRNNFYSIGKKLISGNTDGEDPDDEDPDNDPDDPVNIGESDQVILLINDAWDVLHNMTLE